MMLLVYASFFLLKILFYLFIVLGLLIVAARLIFEPFNAVCKCKTNLHGKVVLVTGGNSGIGLEAARDLAGRGARVIIACRDEKKAREAIQDIIQTTGNDRVEFRYLDLFKPSCIRKFAEDFNTTVDRLDILVNNAGCAGALPKLADNGVDLVMQVNYIGPFLLTNLLMNKLIESKPSRIVILSSKFYYFGKLNLEDLAGAKTDGHVVRYANSKLCNVLWARALAKRLPEGVTANSMHPGFIKTNIFKRLSYRRLIEALAAFYKSPIQGAQTIIHLCVAPELEGCSGGYYTECKLRRFYKVAQDEELVDKVWEESMRLAEK